jgi:hypothetical protein
MFRQFKEKNKNLLRLTLKSALKIEQISVVCKWDLFQIENLNLLFINLLLMIQLYIHWEGEGGAMTKIWNKNTGPDFKQK